MKIRKYILYSLLFTFFTSCLQARKQVVQDTDKVVVAYVTSWSRVMPDPSVMTHLNYAFGHVTESFDGVRVDNPKRLHQMVELKKQNPQLQVMLSIGGWGSGRFSEMVTDPQLRHKFARDCRRVVDEFQLDGIDIDWEYPTSNAAGISAAPTDKDNYTLLMHDIRKAIGPAKQLTLASVASADYIDFPAIMPYVDFVNIMAYDMGGAPTLHSGLFPSEHTRWMTSSQAVQSHLQKGVPAHKLVMGMPFYGRGGKRYKGFGDYNSIQVGDFVQRWDSLAMVPYLMDPQNGELVFGYDDARSLSIKCEYILQQQLHGGMYWDYAGDDAQGTLSHTVWDCLHSQDLYLFTGSYASADQAGIGVYRFNQRTGEFTQISTFSGLSNPSFVNLNADGTRLYCVGEQSGASSTASSLSFNRLTGELSLLNTQNTLGGAPCNIVVSPDQRYVYTANYFGGNVSRFPLLADGKLGDVTLLPFSGSSVDPQRQTKPYLHAVIFTPDARYLLANDLGTDRIHVFLNSDPLQPVQDIQMPAGMGPRHLCWAPNGKFAYALGELSGEIAAISYKSGKFKVCQTILADTVHAAGSADIHITSDGRYLYASHRLQGDGISIFRVQRDGKLQRIGYQSTGIHPRNFIISPNDRYLLVACRDSNEVQIYRRDSSTGLLQDTGRRIAISQPVCLQFLK